MFYCTTTPTHHKIGNDESILNLLSRSHAQGSPRACFALSIQRGRSLSLSQTGSISPFLSHEFSCRIAPLSPPRLPSSCRSFLSQVRRSLNRVSAYQLGSTGNPSKFSRVIADLFYVCKLEIIGITVNLWTILLWVTHITGNIVFPDVRYRACIWFKFTHVSTFKNTIPNIMYSISNLELLRMLNFPVFRCTWETSICVCLPRLLFVVQFLWELWQVLI